MIAVVTFPGSNDDRDAVAALELLGAEARLVWHAEDTLPGISAVVLPGGFSYGDYLRTGAMASLAPAMAAVRRFADAGGPVLGICNGFQILCEARLLPGVLRPNRQLEFVCRDVAVRVERTDTLFTRRCADGQELVVPIKHGEGAWYADQGTYVQLAARGQIVLRTRVVRQVTLARRRHRHVIAVEIWDNGPGIPEDLRERVFHPLVSGREGGTGLGLTLAQTFVNQHHGIVSFESVPGNTCFSILIPAAEAGSGKERRGGR